MTDKVRQDAEALRCFSVADCIDFPKAVHTCMHKAADLIESLAAELEQVKWERDGLSIMLTQAQTMLETRTRERDVALAEIKALNEEYFVDIHTARDPMLDKIRQLECERDSFEDALRSIVFYDGHKEWLVELADILENAQSIVTCPLDHSRWHTEEHTIWMILIGMFGDWGTSIRGGWIERNKDAAEFIRSICTDDTDKED